MSSLFTWLLIAVVFLAPALDAQNGGGAARTAAPARAEGAGSRTAPAQPRTRVTDVAQRNENKAIFQIDNNALKEANVRLGDNVTAIPEPPVELNHYATEHGQPPGESPVLRGVPALPEWHGELFWWHQNSVFNARTFFQAGDVKPSRRNGYGVRFTSGAGKLGFLTLNANQTKIRGMVNGNVLVPLASERTPLATDPAIRAIVSKFLAAYPNELPNRPDFDPRALNTNAPQRVDQIQGDARLDRDIRSAGRLSLLHTLSRRRVDAFQLVAGQNPDTEIHSHRSRLSYRHSVSAATEAAFGFAFTRTMSVLKPEPNAVGPRVRMGFQIEQLGPNSEFPIDRAQNSFRWGGIVTHQAGGGRHALTAGGDLFRYQLNGIETSNQRGYLQFTNNFGRSAIENFRLGTPSSYEVTVGEAARGFRNWLGSIYFSDRWRVRPRLQIFYGLRYSVETSPVEVQGRNQVPYGCDCNNFSPRLSVAIGPVGGWVARTSYTVSFAQIPPVTFQQTRNNPPLVRTIQVQSPSLLNPLAGVDLNNPNVRYSPLLLSPDLVAPYVHQYNFTLEKKFQDRYQVRLGYIGSRTFKTINSFVMNRAEPVPGVALTTETVNQRRPDPRFSEVYHVVNGGIAYLDAAQASLDMPHWKGVVWGARYTFGKAIDQGADYSGTAANDDLTTSRSQWQYNSFGDKKGLSIFDSTHALQIHYSYELPAAASPQNWLSRIVNGWQVSGATLVKSGTPLTLYIGSDAPGFGNVDGGPSDRPNILDPSILGMAITDPNTSPQVLRRDRFAYITPGQPRGSLGRGTFRKSGIANFNTALTKQWRSSGRREWTALLRAETYNLTNHPQFDEPQRNYSSPSFGRITNTLNDGRVMQVSLRFIL